MCKGFVVVVESIFEWLFCNSKVNFVIVFGFGWIYFSLENYIWWQTFPTYRTILLISAFVLIFEFVILVENVHVVVVFGCLDVLHTAVTHFKFISVKYLLKRWFSGKWISSRCKKDWHILIVTLLLYGGLNHIAFR